MIEEDPWHDLVPDAVVDVIEEIDGVDRLRSVVEHE